MKRILITGSTGLIGSELAEYFSNKNYMVFGIDNNFRKKFFGKDGDTSYTKKLLKKKLKNYIHHNLDIRNGIKIHNIIKKIKPNYIVHCAAQPSHDKASEIPKLNHEVNVNGTFNLLESTRIINPKIPFVFLSTNKVYGDNPNKIKLKEKKLRWEYFYKKDMSGISEDLSIDHCTHSLFGASKVSADILVQEYGKYFDMFTCSLRGGCLTGPNHAGVALHGFLSYLIKCNIYKKKYYIFGYKGKQVRDNIHSLDVANFIEKFLQNPRKGEVYNIGGGKKNSISILEAIKKIEKLSKIKMIVSYNKKHRVGDHICYYSDLKKMKKHYPNWKITKNLDHIFKEIYQNWKIRKKN
jgi:CDP-paratose 2-epimerase